MNLQEFKAWFEGFTESLDRPPNAKQWKRIRAKVDEIDGTVTTERIYIDRYLPRYPYWWKQPVYPTFTYGGFGIAPASTGSFTSSSQGMLYNSNRAPDAAVGYSGEGQKTLTIEGFNSTAAFNAMGQADARELDI